MKRIIITFFVVFAMNVYGQTEPKKMEIETVEMVEKGGKPGNVQGQKHSETISLEDLINQLSIQYNDAIVRLAEDGINNIKITEMEISFNTSNIRSVNGNISVIIFKADGTRTTSKESTVTFKLKEDTTAKKSIVRRKDEYNLSDLIYKTAKSYTAINSMPQIEKLKSDSFEIEIEYSVQWNGEATIGGEIFKIGAEATVSAEKGTKHTIKLTFGTK